MVDKSEDKLLARHSLGDGGRNSALMLSTASTETAHEGESNQVRIIRKTLIE